MSGPLDLYNKPTYELPGVVKYFARLDQLQKPELTILNLLKPELPHMKMLDIGVGAGRTTVFFAGLVKEYVGIDYSTKMIEVCQKRFPQTDYNMSFRVGNVKNMDMLEDDYYDFILFSFNGLDLLSHEERIVALEEIKRVAKKEAYFCFSSHNIQSVDNLFKFSITIRPIKLFKKITKYILLRLINEKYEDIRKYDYAIINDGAHRFRLKTYYIKPSFQITQLHDLGFQGVRIFSLEGHEVTHNVAEAKDSWLYYLCTINK